MIKWVQTTSESELKNRGWLQVGQAKYEFDGVYDYHTEYGEDGTEYITTASCIGLVGDKGYCTLCLNEDGTIDRFDYDFDEDGNSRGEDIPFDPKEIIRVWYDAEHRAAVVNN